MSKITLSSLNKKKHKKEKFTCLTAYDYTTARLISSSNVDVILVGDSLGNVVQGHESTIPVSVKDLSYHTQCVMKGKGECLLISDLPFASYYNIEQAIKNAAELMQQGAEIIKIEGEVWLCPIVSALVQQGIPVCGHLGLRPQSVNIYGGYKIQGKTTEQANQLIDTALMLESSGLSLLVLECVPTNLAKEITEKLSIPVIGIGAGAYTDGQILVTYDMIGWSIGKIPSFVKNFAMSAQTPQKAIQNYVASVKSGDFPDKQHSFN